MSFKYLIFPETKLYLADLGDAIAGDDGRGEWSDRGRRFSLADWACAYHGTNLDRFVRIKARYEPENVFSVRQLLPGHVPRSGTPDK